MTHRRHDLLAVALLVLLPTLFFGDVLIGTNNFYLRDLTRYYYPMKQVPPRIVSGGEFPYWNRLISAGQPLAANPEYEIFYPPAWLTFLPDYDLGYRLHILLHFYVALLGMYALLRSMSLRVEAAVFGAIGWGLGGAMLSTVNLLPIFFCASWLPLTCLFTRRFLLRRNGRDFSLASLMLGLQCLVAEPTTIVQTGAILGMYALYRGGHTPPRLIAALRNLAWIAAISVTGVIVGTAQMVPAIDLMRDTIRARGFNFDLVGAWSMPPAKLAELVFPNLLGHTSINGLAWYWGGNLYPGLGTPFLFNIYCGLAVFAFAVAGIVCRRRGAGLMIILFVLSVVIALGAYTPILRMLYDAGLATSLRYPEKFILMGVFAIVIFSAHMLERALAGDHRIVEAAAGFTLAAGIIAALVCLLGFTRLSVFGFLDAFGLQPSAGVMLMIARAWSDWSTAVARALVLLILLLAMHTRRRAIWSSAALLFICADLAGVVAELNPRMPRRFFTDRPPMAEALPADRAAYRVYHQADWESGSAAGRDFFRSGPQYYWVARNGLFPAINVAYGTATVMERDYDKTALLPTTEFGRAVWDIAHSGREEWWPPLMAMSNAWYRTVYNDFADEQRDTGDDITRLAPVALLEEQHQPRYYFADQIVRAGSPAGFVKQMTTQSFSRNVAFVASEPFAPARGVVRAVRETANDSVIDVESFGRAFLVISVTPHKYWRITIDGQKAGAVVTNIGFQGVVIPSGSHRVIMKYRNTLVPVSGGASIIAAAALIGIAVKRRPA